MDGLGHIQYLAKAALTLKADEAIPHIEALARLARERGDLAAAAKLEGIVRDARRRGLLASSNATTSTLSPSGVANVSVRELPEARFLEEPLPAPEGQPLLAPPNLTGVREYLRRSTTGTFDNILFVGPSGTGKTMTAAWMASQLDRPLFRLAFPQIFDSYLGKTARNLAGAFREVADARGILFLDEVDAVLRSRELGSDHGEMQRTVSVLLMEIDHAAGLVPVFAATNLPAHVDRAVTRRFNLVLRFELPNGLLRERFIRSRLLSFPPPYVVPSLVNLTEGFSYSHLENALRRLRYTSDKHGDNWRELLRVLLQAAPPEAAERIRRFEAEPMNTQAREMVRWGIERQVVAAVAGASPALISRWLGQEA